MDVYPQLFDRQQTLTFEPLIGHTRLGGQRAGEPPGSFSTHADRDRTTQESTEFPVAPHMYQRQQCLLVSRLRPYVAEIKKAKQSIVKAFNGENEHPEVGAISPLFFTHCLKLRYAIFFYEAMLIFPLL